MLGLFGRPATWPIHDCASANAIESRLLLSRLGWGVADNNRRCTTVKLSPWGRKLVDIRRRFSVPQVGRVSALKALEQTRGCNLGSSFGNLEDQCRLVATFRQKKTHPSLERQVPGEFTMNSPTTLG